MKTLKSIALTSILLLAGCSAESGRSVVAVVGEERIMAAELEHFIERMPADLRATANSVAALRSMLETLIDKKLLLLEARFKGVENDSLFGKRMARHREELLIALYKSREIAARVIVTDEDLVQRYYDSGRYRALPLAAVRAEIAAELFARKEAALTKALSAALRDKYAEHALIPRRLFLAEAQAQRLHEDPEFLAEVADKRAAGLLSTLRRHAVDQQIAVSDEEARAFYDDHPEYFPPSQEWQQARYDSVARRRAAAYVRESKRHQRFGEYMRRLRQKYPVRIFEENLHKML